jgi:hypothetical protein
VDGRSLRNGRGHMATTTAEAAFLFNNTAFGCIHAAPSFGDIAPHDEVRVNSRVYLARGGLDDFLERYNSDSKATDD